MNTTDNTTTFGRDDFVRAVSILQQEGSSDEAMGFMLGVALACNPDMSYQEVVFTSFLILSGLSR